MATIKINAVTTAINELCKAGIASQKNIDLLRGFAANGRLTKEDARVLLTKGFIANGNYEGEYDPATMKALEYRPGQPQKGRLAKQVREYLGKIFSAEKTSANEKAEYEIPEELMAAARKLARLAAAYDKLAVELGNQALRAARAELKK